jgi:hypothetical protein
VPAAGAPPVLLAPVPPVPLPEEPPAPPVEVDPVSLEPPVSEHPAISASRPAPRTAAWKLFNMTLPLLFDH